MRQIARFQTSEGLNEISRDNGKRRIYVEANIRGRDLNSFVAEARASIDREVKLPAGSWIEWGGQFQNCRQPKARLLWVVPICLGLILVALYAALRSAALTFVVFTAVPLGARGGIFMLKIRGIPFSVSAAVGFIAVSGVAVLNGLVLVASIRHKLEAGFETVAAIVEGSLERLRPVLMTALVASLGFVPMAVATRAGAEVQRPLATVVIGGLITSTLLTLFVLPGICGLVLKSRRAGRGARISSRAGLGSWVIPPLDTAGQHGRDSRRARRHSSPPRSPYSAERAGNRPDRCIPAPGRSRTPAACPRPVR